jgi:hypothetical protein
MVMMRDEMPLRRICEPKCRKSLARSAAVVVLALAAVSCTDETAAPRADQLCEFPRDSSGGKVLRQVLGTDEMVTTIYAQPSHLTERLRNDLEQRQSSDSTLPAYACSFSPKNHEGASTLRIGFSWVPSGGPEKEPRSLGDASHYNLNGVLGESNDIGAGLRMECRLPGKFGTLSRQVLLYADASNTLNMGRDVDQAMKDRQVTFLYFMTRKATDALGCENDPLKKEPVAKPYATASEASRAAA